MLEAFWFGLGLREGGGVGGHVSVLRALLLSQAVSRLIIVLIKPRLEMDNRDK